MGFGLDGLGKLIDPGAMAHQLVDSFLPKDMQWVGGLVGAAVDYECGNLPGALSQGMSALSDLKDTPQSSSQTIGSNAARTTGSNQNQSWSYEPSPPPSRTTTVTTTTTTSSSTPTAQRPSTEGTFGQSRAAIESQLRASQSTTTTTTTTVTVSNQPVATGPAQEARSGPGHFGASSPPAGAPQAVPPPTTTVTVSNQPVAAGPAQEARSGPGHFGASTTPAGVPQAATPNASATDRPGTPPANASGPTSSSGSTDAGGLSDGVKKLLAMSNDDLQRAIASGNIPKDLSNGDMLALQTRMNQISQMNQLMTQMISAMHDMQMAVARNIHA